MVNRVFSLGRIQLSILWSTVSPNIRGLGSCFASSRSYQQEAKQSFSIITPKGLVPFLEHNEVIFSIRSGSC
jgi:hypothetical protein